MKTLKCNGLGKVLYWREAEEDFLFISNLPITSFCSSHSAERERKREKERGVWTNIARPFPHWAVHIPLLICSRFKASGKLK